MNKTVDESIELRVNASSSTQGLSGFLNKPLLQQKSEGNYRPVSFFLSALLVTNVL